jgi:hypothetical protein
MTKLSPNKMNSGELEIRKMKEPIIVQKRDVNPTTLSPPTL